jgi:O-antigen ligase
VSISPESTGWALLLGVCLLLIFWSARASYERSGGLRMVVRGIAWMGFVLSAVVFIQRAVSPDLIYGFWRPIARIDHPHPIGPFLNRNDLAGWLIMAIPMVFAYALARAETREVPGGSLSTAASMLDSRMLGLAAALLLMCAALLASTSRSGLLGAGCALIALTTLGRRRLSRTSTISMLGAIALLLVGATAYTSVSAVAARFGDLAGSQLGGRATVWRETWPMARDFPWTGIGVGGFERGMSVYQQSTRMMFFNHAHNEYLQVLVEGGVLLALPAGIALVAAWVAVASRLRVDRTPMFWLRAGAASAMLAAAVQSLWDTGLRMPANAVLFAIIAAIALHEPARTSSSTRPHGGPSD